MVRNPYGEAGASARIVEVLKQVELRSLSRKIFHDLAAGGSGVTP